MEEITEGTSAGNSTFIPYHSLKMYFSRCIFYPLPNRGGVPFGPLLWILNRMLCVGKLFEFCVIEELLVTSQIQLIDFEFRSF